jgi:hypothetical protein
MGVFKAMLQTNRLAAAATSIGVNASQLFFAAAYWTSRFGRRRHMTAATGSMFLPNRVGILTNGKWDRLRADGANYHTLVRGGTPFFAAMSLVFEMFRTIVLAASITPH